MNISNDELRSLLHNAISCYRDHVNVYRSANPEDEAVNDVMESAQQNGQGKPVLTKEDMFAMFRAGRNSAGQAYPYPLMQVFEEVLQEYEAAQQEEGE